MDPQDYIDLKKIKWEGGIDRKKLVLGAVVVVVVLLAFSSFYQVGTESVGVVLRLGKYTRQSGPGLHFKLPFGLERVYVVPAERQLKEEFGFRTEQAGVRTRYSPQAFLEESLMLTGDLNVASVEWSVQYRIADPFLFLFKVRNVRDTFRAMSEAVMREVVGDRTVNEVLTVGRSELAVATQVKLQELCDNYQTGIRVEQVILQDITPPDPVKPSFNEVNQAQQEKEKLINEARADYNLAVPRARGVAEQVLRQAEGYAVDRVNRARGEAERFKSVFAEFRKAPEVTRRRIYLETLEKVFPQVGRKLIVDEQTGNLVPLLQLGREGQNQ